MSENATPTTGVQKIKYNAESAWDFQLDVAHKPVDISVVLPHYRARNQPVDHRMHIFLGNDSAPIKAKICRNSPKTKFFLDVQASSADVTVYLPSDFTGRIHCAGRPSLSSGFLNRIMPNVRFQDSVDSGLPEDEVVVVTSGRITFRMWDVRTGTPENAQKEALKRMFGRTHKAPETIDWDFLLDD
ncbi:hypothetical protein CPB85DRAFT_1212878 [Mucidula mucida]|nr:hypothetical protein CPB85DRAFT_1212878 [Mucidula mucida]